MTKTQLKKLAEEHAFEILGSKEFKSNPNARTSIMSDFIAGFNKCREYYKPEIKQARKYDILEDKIIKSIVLYNGEEHHDFVIVGQLVLKYFGI